MKLSRAFSLVEVLLAILILALGLLGLGAVIPVVVKQQRTATDRTLGVTAAKDAQADLLSRPQFDPSSLAIPNAWDILLAATTRWSPVGTGATNHLWQPWRDTDDIRLELDTGNLFIYDESVDPSQFAALVIGDRIWPGKSMQTVELQAVGEDRFKPQFVWDIVGRRVRVGANQPPAVQVALFVRRIDLNIRVPKSGPTRYPPTLRDVLVNTNINAADRCVPVAVNGPNDPTPTNRGNNGANNLTYANFLELDVTYDENYPDRIEFESGSDTYIALASQPNQKLVDNFGNVYTVLRVDEDPPSNATGPVVVVSPAIPQSVPIRNGAPTVDDFRQVVFTPQVPGAVRVFTVTRPIK